MPRKYDKQSFNPKFHQFEGLNDEQTAAYEAYKENDILFLIGAAGTGKSHLAVAFAIQDILRKERSRIILSRPVVEAGESLGFLPGDVDEKVYPYMLPLYDCLDKICGRDSEARKRIDDAYELAPLAFLRGRAQPLNATIMTPSGPKTMGEMVIGSEIMGADGMPHKVIGVYPQGNKKVYKVSFSDGTWTECCDEHLWLTQTLSEKRHNKDYSVKQLSEIRKSILTKNGRQKNHKIPTNNPVQFNKKEGLLDPYLLGLLLGDGSLHKSACISFSTKDAELIDRMSLLTPPEIKIVYSSKYDWRLTTGNRNQKNPIKTSLREMGLLGTKSNNKFIPDNYKFNDVKTRLSILQGLMDTDGTVYKDRESSRVQFSSTSEILAKDVVFLVQSLGGIAYLRKREYEEDSHLLNDHLVRHTKVIWIVDIIMEHNPFRLKRKAKKFIGKKPIKLISAVEFIGEKECQCIKVDAKDHLYLTDNFIVTHNTFDGCVCILDEAQNCTRAQLKLFLTRLGKFSKMIVTGDPTQSDLPGGSSGLMEVISKCKDIPGIGLVQFSEEAIVRHPLVAQIVKRI